MQTLCLCASVFVVCVFMYLARTVQFRFELPWARLSSFKFNTKCQLASIPLGIVFVYCIVLSCIINANWLNTNWREGDAKRRRMHDDSVRGQIRWADGRLGGGTWNWLAGLHIIVSQTTGRPVNRWASALSFLSFTLSLCLSECLSPSSALSSVDCMSLTQSHSMLSSISVYISFFLYSFFVQFAQIPLPNCVTALIIMTGTWIGSCAMLYEYYHRCDVGWLSTWAAWTSYVLRLRLSWKGFYEIIAIISKALNLWTLKW